MIKKLLLVVSAAMGGIYLTSDEGKNARESLLKRKSAFEPIIKDLLKQSNEILEGTKSIDSNEVKANIDMLLNEAKQTLIDLDLDKTAETIKEAIRISSKKIRIALNESEKEITKLENKKYKKTPTKKTTKKAVSKKPISKTSSTNIASKKIKENDLNK